MKYKNFVALIAIVIILAIAVGYVVLSHVQTDGSNPQVISGRVTGISNQCHYDGTCSVTLDGSKSIITGCGLTANGKTCKVYDQSKLHVGQQVEATVMKNASGGYDLECDTCTIRVINS